MHLIQRGKSKNWTVLWWFGGKKFCRSTGCKSRRNAEQIARGFLDAQRSGRLAALEATKIRRTAPAISSVIDEYLRCGTARAATRVANVSKLRALLRACGIPETASVTALDQTVVGRLHSHARSAGWSDVYAHAVLRMSRSLWARSLRGVVSYMEATPAFALEPVLPPPRIKRFRAIPPRAYRAICREVIATRDNALVRAFILISRCGMPNREIAHATGLWLDPDERAITIPSQDGAFRPKTHNRIRTIYIKPARFDRHFRSLAGQPVRLVPNAGVRVYRVLSRIVRRHLPNRTKSAYELRKHAGSLVATHHGMLAAAKFLGDRVATAEAYYVDFLRQPPRV
jgi:hypothetical protein